MERVVEVGSSSSFQADLFDVRLIQGLDEIRGGDSLNMAPLNLPKFCSSEAPFFKCPHCDFKTIFDDEASDHVVQFHTFPCENCPSKFLNQDELDFHLGQNCVVTNLIKSFQETNSTNMSCQLCSLPTPTKKEFEQHVKTHFLVQRKDDIQLRSSTAQKIFKINSFKNVKNILQKSTSDKELKQVDLQGKEVTELFHCNLCNFTCTNKKATTDHVESSHCFKCLHCAKIFLSKQNLTTHLSTCAKSLLSNQKNPSFLCKHCEFQTISRQEMNSHIYRLHNFKCSICKESFLTVHELTSHKKGFHGTATIRNLTNFIICPHCDFKSERQNVLDSHIQRLHKFPCSACRQILTTVHELNLHKRACSIVDLSKKSENLENKYNCPLCVYSTNRRGNILRHFRVHPDATDLLKSLDQATHTENQMEVLDSSVLEILVTDLTTKPNESFHEINNITPENSGDAEQNLHSDSNLSVEPPNNQLYSNENLSMAVDSESTKRQENDAKHVETMRDNLYEGESNFQTMGETMQHHSIEKFMEKPTLRLNQLCDQLFPLECKKCDEAFDQCRSLVRHLKNIHHSSMTVECETCGKKFKSRSEGVQHVCSLHLMVKPFDCYCCNAKFSYLKNLRVHFEKHHLRRLMKKKEVTK